MIFGKTKVVVVTRRAVLKTDAILRRYKYCHAGSVDQEKVC